MPVISIQPRGAVRRRAMLTPANANAISANAAALPSKPSNSMNAPSTVAVISHEPADSAVRTRRAPGSSSSSCCTSSSVTWPSPGEPIGRSASDPASSSGWAEAVSPASARRR
jgi:hypothetical protein